MHMTTSEYSSLVKKFEPKTSILTRTIWAYCVGGLICVVGQVFVIAYRNTGLPTELALSYASITMVFIGALLTAFNLYDKIASKAGAGSLVPITGFSNSIAAAAMEFKSEGYVGGLGCRIFNIAGPVITYGVVTSIAYGLILVLFRLV